MALQNNLIRYAKTDESIKPFFFQSQQGSFWHWRRVYVLKDDEGQIYLIRLNIFKRIYGNLVGCGMENYFKTVFSDKKIVGLLSKQELDILVYNTSKPRILDIKWSDLSSFEKIYQQIDDETRQWRGMSEINVKTPSPYLNGPHQRKEWWGRFAETIGSTGLNTLIDQATESGTGIALDIGCGNSESAIYLLQKGWTVICLDNSQKALSVMEERAKRINQEWLNTNQLRLVCCDVEEYEWPFKFDLVLASSALPYFNPSKIKGLMQNIYQNLKENGNFIGNFFASKYVGAAINVSREMGAWFIPDIDSVGYLLAGQGYEITQCGQGGPQNPHSVVFIGKKTQLD